MIILALAAPLAVPKAALAAPAMGDADDTDLTNGGWDEKSQRMTGYGKGRGISDCGTSQNFAWDGARLRMTKMTGTGECRGSIDYIRTWTARIGR